MCIGSFDEGGHHFLCPIGSLEDVLELWLLQPNLFVSLQNVGYSNLAFNQGQVLSDAVSLPRVEGEEREGVYLFEVDGVPAIRVEYLRVVIKLCLEMVGRHVYGEACSSLDGYGTYVMVLDGFPIKGSRGGEIHP